MKTELYLVTGAMGHVGNTVVKKLQQQGKNVRGLVLPSDQSEACGKNVPLIYGDVRDRDSLLPFFAHDEEQQDLIVIHTAGIVSIASHYQQQVYDVNVTGTKNIVDLCVQYAVKKLVYVSSVHAIPEAKNNQVISEVDFFHPDDVHGFYAKTKSEASEYVLHAARKTGLNASIVHPSGIIGPGDYGHGHLTQMIIDYLDGRLTACVRGGYDFVDVRDVADGILSCVEQGRPGECYILSNNFYPVKDILNQLHEITGRKEMKTVLPLWFAKAAVPFAEIYYKMLRQPPLYTAYSLDTLESNANFSHKKATAELRYSSRPMEQTLRDTAHWLCDHQRVKKAECLQFDT